MSLNVVVSGPRAEVLEYVYRQGCRDDLVVPANLDDASLGNVTENSELCVVRLLVDVAPADIGDRARSTGGVVYCDRDDHHEHREAL